MRKSGTEPRPARIAALALLFVPLLLVLFRARRLGPLDFWAGFSLAIAAAVALAFALDGDLGHRLAADLSSGLLRKSVAGLLSALALYAVFAAGRAIVGALLPSAVSSIASVYSLRVGSSLLRLVLLLGLLIGPGEELVWRGVVQDRLGLSIGPRPAFAITSLGYAAVHLSSGNAMLVLAALVCGLFWGWLYLRFRSPLLNAFSHAAWDILIFVVRPL